MPKQPKPAIPELNEAEKIARAESHKRLDEEVERQKRLRAQGKVDRPSNEELKAELNASVGITSLGEQIAPAVEIFKELHVKAKAHGDSIREKLASVQPESCIEHPEVTLEIDEDKSIEQSWIKNNFTIAYKPCPACGDIKKAAADSAKWLGRGIPHKVLHATFDNFETEGDAAKKKAVAKFRAQVARGGGFIIALGKWGTGKSHLASATLRALGGGLFITEHDLIGELRQTYAENSGQDELVDKYRKAKALVLDEVTPEVKGVDISPLLYRVLGHRHDNDLLTVLTSNEELEVVMQILGPKLRDRIRENYTIANFTWESHRKPHL